MGQSLANELAQLEGRLSDAEAAAARGGKAAMAKLESKIRDLEAELASTQARTGESAKAYQRAERKCKELVFSSGEDKKNQDRMSDLAAKLQAKIKTYKQQIEEAEEIAALNLAKFRRPSRSWRRPRREPSWPPLSRDHTLDPTVKIRRKPVRAQLEPIPHFDPRMKIKKSPNSDSRAPLPPSILALPAPLPFWMFGSSLCLLSLLDFSIFTPNTFPNIQKKKKKKKKYPAVVPPP